MQELYTFLGRPAVRLGRSLQSPLNHITPLFLQHALRHTLLNKRKVSINGKRKRKKKHDEKWRHYYTAPLTRDPSCVIRLPEDVELHLHLLLHLVLEAPLVPPPCYLRDHLVSSTWDLRRVHRASQPLRDVPVGNDEAFLMRVQSGEPGRHDVRNREAFFFWGGEGGRGAGFGAARFKPRRTHIHMHIKKKSCAVGGQRGPRRSFPSTAEHALSLLRERRVHPAAARRLFIPFLLRGQSPSSRLNYPTPGHGWPSNPGSRPWPSRLRCGRVVQKIRPGRVHVRSRQIASDRILSGQARVTGLPWRRGHRSPFLVSC